MCVCVCVDAHVAYYVTMETYVCVLMYMYPTMLLWKHVSVDVVTSHGGRGASTMRVSRSLDEFLSQ